MENTALNLVKKQKENNSLSHAYLLVGPNGLNTALDMTKEILGNNEAINYRIDQGSYADLKIISGKETSIKKEDILDLQHMFSKTSLEENPNRVYILEDVDNSTIVAMNSLLKFLEEPQPNITAILTTKYENRVLETIKSRCMIVHSHELNSIYEELVEEGIDIEDSKLLSLIFNQTQDGLDYVETKEYVNLKTVYYELISAITHQKIELLAIHLQNSVKDKVVDKDNYPYLLIWLIDYFRTHKGSYTLIKHLLQSKDEWQPGFNLSNIVDGLIYNIDSDGGL